MPSLTLEEKAQRGAQIWLADHEFTHFLSYVRIRSDDPLHPTEAAWEMWDYLLARAESWDVGTSEVIVKARQLGYTWLAAAYLCYRARQGWACAVISKGQDEARAVLSRIRFIEHRLPNHLKKRATFNADSCEYTSGGSVRAFPSTPDAGVSYTHQLVVFDEFAFHPHGANNLGAITPTTGAGGQMLIMSTADPSLGPSGIFHDMYWNSKDGLSGYKAHFEPWFARPGRDQKWLKREKARYVGLPEEFDAWYPDTDIAAFVARSGLVFPQFSNVRHVRAERVPIAECVRIVAGVDFGGGDPTAVVILGLDKQHHIHQYAEFYRRGSVGLDAIGGFLSGYDCDVIVCDPSQGVAIETLRQTYGLPARAAENKRGEGLGMVATLLDHDRLTISPDCKDSIAEFPGYRWANKTDPNDRTRYATTTPVDHHADAHDARRYAILEVTAMLYGRVGQRIVSLTGRPIAKVAV